MEQLSNGMQRLVERAALDPEFERELLDRRAGAAKGTGIVLDTADRLALDALPAEDFTRLIRSAREGIWRTPGHLTRAAGVAAAVFGIGLVGSTGASAADPTDTDGDGLTDEYELSIGTDPEKWDTDGDGMDDFWEVQYEPFTDPLTWDADAVPDMDGWTNLEEYRGLSDPGDPDSWPYELSGDIGEGPGCATAGRSLAALGLPLAAALLVLRRRWSAFASDDRLNETPH